MAQGYAIVRLQGPEIPHWYRHNGRYMKRVEPENRWRKLIRLCRHLRARMDYNVTFYLDAPIPVAVVEWPGRWMKPSNRAVRISSWVGSYSNLSGKGMESYNLAA